MKILTLPGDSSKQRQAIPERKILETLSLNFLSGQWGASTTGASARRLRAISNGGVQREVSKF